MMTRLRRDAVALGTVALVGLLMLAGRPAEAARCRKICKPAIQSCVAAGERRGRCKRGIGRACKRIGQSVCLPPVAPVLPPPAPTTLDVNGSWRFDGQGTSNPCGIEAPASVTGGAEIQQNGSLLSGAFGQGPASGQFTAADAFILVTEQVCATPGCCGTGTMTASGVGGAPGQLSASATFTITASCMGLTCSVEWQGTLQQESASSGGRGGPRTRR
jgi:hypothetical protein